MSWPIHTEIEGEKVCDHYKESRNIHEDGPLLECTFKIKIHRWQNQTKTKSNNLYQSNLFIWVQSFK